VPSQQVTVTVVEDCVILAGSTIGNAYESKPRLAASLQLLAVGSPYCTDNACHSRKTHFHADLMHAICNHQLLSMVT